MEYDFRVGTPLSEEAALAEAAELGLHHFAFEDVHDEDEPLHWHEFDAITWVIAGTGRVETGDGQTLELGPGCRLVAPAGWLHRALAGSSARLVLGTSLAGEQWSAPINKDPSELPESLRA